MAVPGQPSPDDLLMQIRELLDQYLALGEDTPVAPEAQALAAAIDGAAGGGAPPEAGGMPPVPGEPMGPEAMPEDMMGMGGGNFGSFGEANAALLEDMKKKKSKGR